MRPALGSEYPVAGNNEGADGAGEDDAWYVVFAGWLVAGAAEARWAALCLGCRAGCVRAARGCAGAGSFAAAERITVGPFAAKVIWGVPWLPVAIRTVTRTPIDAAARPLPIAPALAQAPFLPPPGRRYATSLTAAASTAGRRVAR